jgi:hypothetical protein
MIRDPPPLHAFRYVTCLFGSDIQLQLSHESGRKSIGLRYWSIRSHQLVRARSYFNFRQHLGQTRERPRAAHRYPASSWGGCQLIVGRSCRGNPEIQSGRVPMGVSKFSLGISVGGAGQACTALRLGPVHPRTLGPTCGPKTNSLRPHGAVAHSKKDAPNIFVS